MRTNSDINIYSKYYDSQIRRDGFMRTYFPNVYFEDNNAVRQDKSGFTVNDNIFIMIPFTSEHNPTNFNINTEDLIVKGLGPEFISVSELKKINDSETIRKMEPYTPFDTGYLKDDAPKLGTVIGSGKLIQNASYAKKQY